LLFNHKWFLNFRSWLKNGFNKWRLLLLVFIVIYAFRYCLTWDACGFIGMRLPIYTVGYKKHNREKKTTTKEEKQKDESFL